MLISQSTSSTSPHLLVMLVIATTPLLCSQTAVAQAPATVERPATDDQSQAAKLVDESWSIVKIQGTRVGHEHSTVREEVRDGEEIILSASQLMLVVKRFNMAMTMRVSIRAEEDAGGNLRAIEFELDNPPNSSNTANGRVVDGVLTLATSAGDKKDTLKITLPPETKSPLYVGRLLESHDWKPGESVEIKSFDPQFNKVDTITMTAGEPTETKLFDGSKATLTPITSTHSLIPVLRETSYLSDEGNILKGEVNLLQTVAFRVTQEEALKELSGEEIDLAIDTLVHVKPIRNAKTTKRIVYRIASDRADLTKLLPTGETQSVKSLGPQGIALTVTSLRPSDLKESADSESADLSEFLDATSFLDWKDADVARHANRAAKGFENPIDIAVAMEGYVAKELKEKGFSTAMATAAEVADSMAGDCTEHAVLLAAMLRARQIPSRVVVGLVYADSLSAFAGHMWTEANLHGRWVPLDATLGNGGIGATHIKFADSSLAGNAPLPADAFATFTFLLDSLTIEVQDVEHAR